MEEYFVNKIDSEKLCSFKVGIIAAGIFYADS
jgi:hypothetical protein